MLLPEPQAWGGQAGSPVFLQDLTLKLSTSLFSADKCMHVFYEVGFTVPILCLFSTHKNAQILTLLIHVTSMQGSIVHPEHPVIVKVQIFPP